MPFKALNKTKNTPKPKKHMKKTIVLVTAFLFAAIVSQAQTEKGNQTLGLSLGYIYSNTSGVNTYNNSSSDAGSKYTSFNLGPSYSYFIADKLDLGAKVSYSQGISTYPDVPNSISKTSSYTFISGVYLRKYCMFGDKLGLRAGPYLLYAKENNKNEYFESYPSAETKIDIYSAGANLDLVYFPSKKLGFAAAIAGVNYNHTKNDYGNVGHSSSDNVNLSFINSGLSLSVFYVFGSK